MYSWVTKYVLPFLVIALIVALYFDSKSVEMVPLDASYSEPVATSPGQRQTVSRPSLTLNPQAPATVMKSRLAIGERYTSLKELDQDQTAAGYVRIGNFGEFWPASVAEVATDRDNIVFVRQNGAQQNYKGFAGYNIKMIRLWRGNKETIVIYRSENKR
jgi:hypothetical protein